MKEEDSRSEEPDLEHASELVTPPRAPAMPVTTFGRRDGRQCGLGNEESAGDWEEKDTASEDADGRWT